MLFIMTMIPSLQHIHVGRAVIEMRYSVAFRIVSSAWMTLLGLVSLKIYHDRNRDNIWGNIYRTLSVMTSWLETDKYGFVFSGKIMLYLGWAAVIFGLCILLLGK